MIDFSKIAFLRDIDSTLGRFVLEKTGSEVVAQSAALLSFLLSEGHICLNVSSINEQFCVEGEEGVLHFPDTSQWIDELLRSDFVSRDGNTPMILNEERLYFHKYFLYEKSLVSSIKEKLSLSNHRMSFALEQFVSQLFHAPSPGNLKDFGGHLQLAAGLIPLFGGFTVISGGPGTGKTTVLSKILATLLQVDREQTIALAAPTGKAAMRMNESLRSAIDTLPVSDDIRKILSQMEALTVHRLLGTVRHSPHFRHNEKRPLLCDILVVDEASMVDFALMAKLLKTVKKECHIILLGDMNQLSSVEAGSVLGDICTAFGVNQFSAQFCEVANRAIEDKENFLQASGEMISPVVHLKRSYRFGPQSGIGNISRAIIEENSALELWRENRSDCTLASWVESPEYVEKELHRKFRPLTNAKSVEEALKALELCKVLTATRVGSMGSNKINEILSLPLRSGGDLWYNNMPVMILENSYNIRLFNGDTGVIRLDENGVYKAYFETEEGIRSFLPATLPNYSLAYAITVHKSQGSEFDEVITLLPAKESTLITKELIYTAITRAKKRAHTIADLDQLAIWLKRKVERGSGLAEKLKGLK